MAEANEGACFSIYARARAHTYARNTHSRTRRADCGCTLKGRKPFYTLKASGSLLPFTQLSSSAHHPRTRGLIFAVVDDGCDCSGAAEDVYLFVRFTHINCILWFGFGLLSLSCHYSSMQNVYFVA